MKMKLFLILTTIFIYDTITAQSVITSPISRAVYQRSSSNNATIWIAGQIFTSTLPAKIQYRVITLDINGTNPNNPSWNDIPSGSIQLGRLYRHSVTLSSGWYKLEVRALNSSSTQLTIYDVKFGVGEVFVVAGQSNAMGGFYSDNINQSITAPPDGFVYDCISIADYSLTSHCVEERFVYPSFTQMYPYGNVGPYGDGIWAYGRLAKRIVDDLGIPVMIFNAALAGTTISEWETTASGGSVNHFLCGRYSGFPYLGLKNTLNLYSSVFGIRAVLWHQGEFDNNNTSRNDYKNKLKNIISYSRQHLDNQSIPWVISKVSYFNLTTDANITDAQSDVVNDGTVSPVTWGATNQDNLRTVSYTLNGTPNTKSNRQTDQVHFSDAGLLYLADDYHSKLSSITAMTPVVAKDLGTIQIQALSGTSWRLTASGTGVSTYKWSTDFCSYNYPCNTASTSSIDKSSGWWHCYLRNSNGNFIMTPRVSLPLPANGARVSAANLIPVTIYPNPTDIDNEIKIEFELKEDSKNFSLDLVDNEGKLIKNISYFPHGRGKYSYKVNTSKIQFKNGQNIIYLKLSSDGYGQTDRILIQR